MLLNSNIDFKKAKNTHLIMTILAVAILLSILFQFFSKHLNLIYSTVWFRKKKLSTVRSKKSRCLNKRYYRVIELWEYLTEGLICNDFDTGEIEWNMTGVFSALWCQLGALHRLHAAKYHNLSWFYYTIVSSQMQI